MSSIAEKTEKTESPAAEEVICDVCGCLFVPMVIAAKDGEVEHTFFRCRSCGKTYTVCVTDEKLKEGIRKYRKLAALNKARRLDLAGQIRMQKQKAWNVEREKEIRAAFFKEHADG